MQLDMPGRALAAGQGSKATNLFNAFRVAIPVGHGIDRKVAVIRSCPTSAAVQLGGHLSILEGRAGAALGYGLGKVRAKPVEAELRGAVVHGHPSPAQEVDDPVALLLLVKNGVQNRHLRNPCLFQPHPENTGDLEGCVRDIPPCRGLPRSRGSHRAGRISTRAGAPHSATDWWSYHAWQ
eukprot:scaffold279_cov229-Pinguiococcus_pyrenoidosus.AAC.11